MACARPILLAAALLAAPLPARALVPVGGVGRVPAPVHLDGAGIATRRALRAFPVPAAVASAQYAAYRWPLERALGAGVVIVNYTDLDPSTARLDYTGAQWNYDGHGGTDLTLHGFRDMDRGVSVIAAADGVVAYASDESPFDRHCDFAWPDDGNWLWVQSADGTFHSYYHFRSHSRTVRVGDAVNAGQRLGLVGSSGYSTAPHLHFEAGAYDGPGGTYRFRDPFTGAANPLPSLWQSQPAYAGAEPLRMLDMGVFSEASVRGSIFNTTFCDVLEGLPQPAVVGRSSARLAMWFLLQSRAGDSAHVVVRRPNGTPYGEFDLVFAEPVQFGWLWAWFWFAGGVGPADDGTWSLEVWREGALHAERPFVVGEATSFAPRFAPPAGRSFTIDGTVQRDTLRSLPGSPPVTCSLVGGAGFASLDQDSVLRIEPTSPQPTRSAFFQVVMSDAQARRDTAFYHVVDFSKPHESLASAPAVTGTLALAAAPNPFASDVTVRAALPGSGFVRVDVLDLAGRRVRTLAAGETVAGPAAWRWDGRDGAGAAVPPGLYFARIRTATGEATLRLARAH